MAWRCLSGSKVAVLALKKSDLYGSLWKSCDGNVISIGAPAESPILTSQTMNLDGRPKLTRSPMRSEHRSHR